MRVTVWHAFCATLVSASAASGIGCVASVDEDEDATELGEAQDALVVGAAAYSLGVGMGIARYQASVNQTALVHALFESREADAEVLRSQNLLDTIPSATTHEQTVAECEAVERRIRTVSNYAANLFLLGMLIGLAEGHTSSGGGNYNRAVEFAHMDLQGAKSLIVSRLNSTRGGVDIGLPLTTLDAAIMMTENFGAGQKNTYAKICQVRQELWDAIRTAEAPIGY